MIWMEGVEVREGSVTYPLDHDEAYGCGQEGTEWDPRAEECLEAKLEVIHWATMSRKGRGSQFQRRGNFPEGNLIIADRAVRFFGQAKRSVFVDPAGAKRRGQRQNGLREEFRPLLLKASAVSAQRNMRQEFVVEAQSGWRSSASMRLWWLVSSL